MHIEINLQITNMFILIKHSILLIYKLVLITKITLKIFHLNY